METALEDKECRKVFAGLIEKVRKGKYICLVGQCFHHKGQGPRGTSS